MVNVAWGVWELGLIEWYAGDPPAAENGFRELCDFLRDVGDTANLAEATAYLAELLLVLGRDDEALLLTDEIRSIATPYDAGQQTRWRSTRSVALARLGRLDEAMPMIEESERLARTTDFVAMLAGSMLSKAEVLKLADRREDAVSRRS